MSSGVHHGPHRVRVVFLALAVFAITVAACGGPAENAPSPVFTPARASVAAAMKDFFGIRPTAQQPFPFPHKRHIEKKLKCTDYCHESVDKGPIAGIPSVKTCMVCHESIASDKPLIKTVADYQKRGIDIPWQRVYGYPHESHVKFNHAPHIRAKVGCETCHGSVDQQGVAERNVNLNMGFCVDCHNRRQASNDCLTCHF